MRFYIITPIGADPDHKLKRESFESLALSDGHQFVFPEYDLRSQAFSIANMLARLASCDAVIADLSLERPSCYFELGVAEATGKKVALLAGVGTPIHQTGHRETVCFFAPQEFEAKLREAISEL